MRSFPIWSAWGCSNIWLQKWDRLPLSSASPVLLIYLRGLNPLMPGARPGHTIRGIAADIGGGVHASEPGEALCGVFCGYIGWIVWESYKALHFRLYMTGFDSGLLGLGLLCRDPCESSCWLVLLAIMAAQTRVISPYPINLIPY